VFADDGFGAGWAWDDLAFSYSAPARGLQFNQNAAQVVVAPGTAVGSPAVVTVRPSYAELPIQAEVLTTGAGSRPALTARPAWRGPVSIVTGSVAVDSAPISRPLAVANPVRYYATAVREGLRSGGVDVRDAAVDVGELPDAPTPPRGDVLMTHRSPTLASMGDTMMRFSQNLYAETLLRTLGVVRHGSGTADAGRLVVRDTLAAWGIAGAMSAALAHVYADDRLRESYVAALPRAGRTGTLVNRMKGTAAEGTVAAKTGSFLNARAIAGYAETADHEPLAFTIIANNYGVAPEAVDRISDAIIVSLAEFTRSPDHR
jgi:D-alanyl-D-alanine carboxypeptidase/D-alanyl-D-alanine-endopeptidase (penicillin-binding protein 4)